MTTSATPTPIDDEREHWLRILRHNHGFVDPERWVAYARSHGFRRVDAKPLKMCPDCGAVESSSLGQYVYYSTLLQLRLCGGCGLAYADAHIDPRIIETHFETAYKDEQYFVQRREPVFHEVARLVDAHAPPVGKVIDIGGAKGHLLAAIQSRRPDLALTLNDIAEAACAYARTTYGFRTFHGSAGELGDVGERFDVILMIDVIYYEPDIRTLWQTVDRLSAERCTVILRVPDRIRLISMHRMLGALLGRERRETQNAIPYFNPEHIYVFSKSYLWSRLKRLGFAEVEFLPSPSLRRPGLRGQLGSIYPRVARLIQRATRSSATLTPSFIAVARRSSPLQPSE